MYWLKHPKLNIKITFLKIYIGNWDEMIKWVDVELPIRKEGFKVKHFCFLKEIEGFH